MRPTLPSAFRQKAARFALLLAVGCHHAEPPVAPGEPIPAEPDVSVDTMDKECDGLLSALHAYGECPNADDDDRAWAKAVSDVAERSFAAGKKGEADEKAQGVIARACHKATSSVHAATERCHNGPRPRVD